MLKNTLIIALVIVIIYLAYQKQNTLANFTNSTGNSAEIEEVKKVNKTFADFCHNEIGGKDIQEIRTKLNGRTLSQILEENEDYETEKDELTRKKGELEAEITLLTNSRQNQIQEKERIITRLKEEKSDLEKKYKQKAKKPDEEQLKKDTPLADNWKTNRITELETTLRTKEAKIQELEKTLRETKK